MFDEDHPAMISVNGNLITSYTATKMDKEIKRAKIMEIIEKNYAIASIFVLKNPPYN